MLVLGICVKNEAMSHIIFFFFKQKTAYEIGQWLEFRRVLFRSNLNSGKPDDKEVDKEEDNAGDGGGGDGGNGN